MSTTEEDQFHKLSLPVQQTVKCLARELRANVGDAAIQVQFISTPATCSKCKRNFHATTTGKILNNCSFCYGILIPDAPEQQEIIVWLAHMVSFNEQLAANESADARDREKFRNYASAYNSALTKAKQFAKPSASVQEAAERAIDAVGMGLYANDTFKFYPEKRAALATTIASHFAGFVKRDGK